jgi:hypothetical protein
LIRASTSESSASARCNAARASPIIAIAASGRRGYVDGGPAGGAAAGGPLTGACGREFGGALTTGNDPVLT